VIAGLYLAQRLGWADRGIARSFWSC